MMAESELERLTEINAAHAGWYDIRTGTLHPVIWGSGLKISGLPVQLQMEKWLDLEMGGLAYFPNAASCS